MTLRNAIGELRFRMSGKRILIPDQIGTDVKYDEVGGAYIVLELERKGKSTFVIIPEENAVEILDDVADLLSRKGGRLHKSQPE